MAELTPVALVRYSSNIFGARARTVHLISAQSIEARAVSTLCGTLLNIDAIEIVPFNQPCNACLVTRIMSAPGELADHGSSEVPRSTRTYQAWAGQ